MSSASSPLDPSRVLPGLGNTVDYEIEWNDVIVSGLMRRHRLRLEDASPDSTIESESALLRSLLDHLISGTGGEHFVTSSQVLADFASRFRVRVTLGGTNMRAAVAMRILGRASTVHLVSTGDMTRSRLPAEVLTISSAGADSLDPHLIMQFPADARIQLDGATVVAPRANRVIYVNDQANRQLVVAEAFGDAVARADVVLVSGFNSIQDRLVLDSRLTDVRRHLARRGPGAVAVYEHGAFHVPAFADVVRRHLGPAVDVWSCNEEELQAQVGSDIDLLCVGDVLAAVRAAHASVGAATLVVHTRYWALAVGGDPDRGHEMVRGGVDVAGARYAHGDSVGWAHLAGISSWPVQQEGSTFAVEVEAQGGADVVCVPAYRVTTDQATTVGLGDAFVGGLVAALAALADRVRPC